MSFFSTLALIIVGIFVLSLGFSILEIVKTSDQKGVLNILKSSMGIPSYEIQEIVLFSALEGRVIKDGKPVKNAVLIREWNFAEDSVRGKDETKTDENGVFRFPVVLHAYKPPIFLAQEMFISQLIRVQKNDQEWRVWVGSKHDKRAGTERSREVVEGTSPDIALNVTIDLDSEKKLRGGVVGHTFFDATDEQQ